jgi:SET domain-containing protein
MNSKNYLSKTFIRYANNIQIDTNKTFIIPSNLNIEIKYTRTKGYGVFATSNFKSGDIIEKCYCVPVTKNLENVPSFLKNYVFKYVISDTEDTLVLPLGYGSIYNHSNNNNAKWEKAEEHMFFNFIAVKDINKGEEICTNYGVSYLQRNNLNG